MRRPEKPPRVSVIVPCHNTHRYLGQTLDSIRTQTTDDLEIIVVDDGSTDPETIAYLNALDDDVRVVRQRNRGLAGARNTGFREARGTYVVPLDCDDWIDTSFIERTLAAIERNSEASFAVCHINLEDEASGVLRKHYNFFEQLFLNQLPYCVLIPKAVWEEVGGYDQTLRRGYEDWEFSIRLGARGKFGVVVPEPLFHYRVREAGMLKSVSSNLHGQLWGEIQQRNSSQYGVVSLVRTWRRWRNRPSTYPLVLYFGWWALYKLLPKVLFSAVFRRILPFSQSQRVGDPTGAV